MKEFINEMLESVYTLGAALIPLVLFLIPIVLAMYFDSSWWILGELITAPIAVTLIGRF